jgi:glycosyltransferase involved in cell wall biosynthesis
MISYLRAKDSYALLPCVDRFVLLTKHMADRMGLTQPWCVMEGIAAVPEELPEATPTNDPIKTVMYTGTLHKRFGVMHLVEAFSRIEDPQMRLVLCGIGDSEADIRRAAEKDGRISFLGQLKRDEVIRLQRQATVLVNPRPGDEEFTKYSFPSKTMEYLASGVPVVAYKLAGIEDEYDAYLQYPEDGTVEALADKISQICRLEPQDWARLGAQGRQFVLGQKNARVQSRKILAFCGEDQK